MYFKFRSLQSRVLVFIVGLLLLVQSSVFLVVDWVNINNARHQIDEALTITAIQLSKTLSDRARRLQEVARLLSGDYPFKQVAATQDHGTILSVLRNQSTRAGADIMMLLTLDRHIIADTLHPDMDGDAFMLPNVIEAAEDSKSGETSGIHIIDEHPYQLVIAPLLAPDPIAWIVIGYSITDNFAREIQRYTQSEVSLLTGFNSSKPSLEASTLPDHLRPDLLQWASSKHTMIDESLIINLSASEYVSLVSPVWRQGNNDIVVVLQRSLDEALAPYSELRNIMFFVFLTGLILSIISGGILARSVTHPVRRLAEAAHRIRSGDYSQQIDVRQADELGALADSFNEMTKGLIDRDRTRSLLGKVVSPEIAQELLSKEIELGGEEREATILFVDIRDFTSICENKVPSEIVELLNRYLTTVSNTIETHGGVIDKYIGDAIMALFGAPLSNPDDATQSIMSALAICSAMNTLNQQLNSDGIPNINYGIGINTGSVIAGNIGSSTRLNYTVIGDAVNLAARLEGLTKIYGVSVLVSQTTMEKTSGIAFRQLDLVRVKGKQEEIFIYQPMGTESEISDRTKKEIEDFHVLLELYRDRSWSQALEGFQVMDNDSPCTLYKLYIDRCQKYITQPPAPEWDGATIYNRK